MIHRAAAILVLAFCLASLGFAGQIEAGEQVETGEEVEAGDDEAVDFDEELDEVEIDV